MRDLLYETDEDGQRYPLYAGPVHEAFGLSYANYFVMPRVLMSCMPLEWQQRFVDLSNEFWDEWDYSADKDYEVRLRDERGRWVKDELSNYRYPNMDHIRSLHRQWVEPNTD